MKFKAPKRPLVYPFRGKLLLFVKFLTKVTTPEFLNILISKYAKAFVFDKKKFSF